MICGSLVQGGLYFLCTPTLSTGVKKRRVIRGISHPLKSMAHSAPSSILRANVRGHDLKGRERHNKERDVRGGIGGSVEGI